MRKLQSFGLVATFGITSLATFLAIAAILTIVARRHLEHRQLQEAQEHATFVAESMLRYRLSEESLNGSLSEKRFEELHRFVSARLLEFPIVRVKIWSNEGTVIYSDEPRLVGDSFELGDGLTRALRGETVSYVSHLDKPENPFEREMAGKLLETYVPLYLPGSMSRGPDAVIELYQDYAGVQAEIDQLLRTLIPILLVGLAVLYVLQLPLALRIDRILSRKNEQLEEQAARLEELLHKERVANSKLEEMNRLKGEFVDVASHELRNPLAAIAASIKTLLRPEASDPMMREELLHMADHQVDRLSKLTERLLISERLENGRFPLAASEFALKDVVEEVIAGLGSRGDRVRMHLSHDLPRLRSDRSAVQEILTNLIENAFKFSPDTSPCEVRAWSSDGLVIFLVRDHGPGIPEGRLERIFERFYRVDSSLTRAESGMGLGLSIVKELLNQVHGTIVVSSGRQDGTEFTVTLPIRHPSIDAAPEEATAPGGPPSRREAVTI
ncbi:MAG: sensor histidine kinase [Actinomycetota bacterium]